jgi:hypothetical protein
LELNRILGEILNIIKWADARSFRLKGGERLLLAEGIRMIRHIPQEGHHSREMHHNKGGIDD